MGPAGQVQGQDLDRLAQAHVVGQHPTDTQVGHLGQPGQAPFLVRAEDGDEVGRRGHGALGIHRREPVRQIGQRALQLDVDGLAADGQGPAEGGGQRLPRFDPAAFQDPGQGLRVGPHPTAPQADHRAAGLSQGVQLLFGQLLVADGRLPSELDEGVQGQARRGHGGRRRRDHGLHLDGLHE